MTLADRDTNDSGNRSSGVEGRWVGDNYTTQVVDAVAASPMDLAGDVDPSTVVTVIVGDSDNVAPPAFSRAYAARLEERHMKVKLIEIPGAPHNIVLDPRVLSEITASRYLIDRVALDHARRPGPDS